MNATRATESRAMTALDKETTRQATTSAEWVRRFADALGVQAPSDEEANALLELSGVAAHASERTAAPLSVWLVGRAGLPAAEASAIAAKLASSLGEDDNTR